MSSPPDTATATDDSPVAAATSGESQPQDPPTVAATADTLSEKLDKMNISSSSFSIWPPTQRTRDAVINRLIETLSTPSVLSKRYGSMSHDEAESTAKAIEEEAYNAAASGGGGGGDAASSVDEGLEILQVYSKEISKRMLEAVKSKAAAATTTAGATETAASGESPAPESGGPVAATEEGSSVVEESSS